eukprot:318093-Rhodomonas_salina.3
MPKLAESSPLPQPPVARPSRFDKQAPDDSTHRMEEECREVARQHRTANFAYTAGPVSGAQRKLTDLFLCNAPRGDGPLTVYRYLNLGSPQDLQDQLSIFSTTTDPDGESVQMFADHSRPTPPFLLRMVVPPNMRRIDMNILPHNTQAE